MPHETHVLRFKVVTVECPTMPTGQQYTIMYHRGRTSRSTPCYTAQSGVVNFATMPEGAALVHFKSGHGGMRYAPKYIRFMVDEYTRGQPRRLVGEAEVDCTQVLKDYSSSGSGILTVAFRLYGNAAKMQIAILVYPEHALPLSFDGLIDPNEGTVLPPPQLVKVMNRSEAMIILMGLERLLERRRTMELEGQRKPQSREEKQLEELIKIRKALVNSEGLATEVIKTRCEEVVAMQYIAHARKYRNNFIGETGAYLREMAISNGDDFISDEGDKKGTTLLEQLNRVNHSIEDVRDQVKRLKEEQVALDRIQSKTDLTEDGRNNLDKVAALEKKLQLLQQSRTALTDALKKRAAKKDTPLSREMAAINARIAALNAEQQQMTPKIQHMMEVATSHVVKWARSKNPPEPEIRNRINILRDTSDKGRDIFEGLLDDAGTSQNSNEPTTLADMQHKHVLKLLKGLAVTAPSPTAHSATSSSSSSGHRTPQNVFDGAGLPAMGDLSVAKKVEEEESAAKKPNAIAESVREGPPTPAREDPLKPPGLGIDMFSSTPALATASTVQAGLPSMGDFMHSSASLRQQGPEPVFDFGTVLQATSVSPQMDSDFVLEPQRSEQPTSSFATAPPAVTNSYNKKDDPYYDEMDDFTVPADTNNAKNYGTVEIVGGFPDFGNDGNSSVRADRDTSSSPGYAAPRPTFDFGPSGGGDEESSEMRGMALPAEAFSFGAAATDAPSANNRSDRSDRSDHSDNPYRGVTNLPTYNFGS
ncbi:conserved hypothetical protein [Leishmania braziliensis MHOM/BR/75/M2904]|uniref:C2 NT-type domain-containing protein n=2 Tax=Leishmania braziliensis TaxID=5660 RepID=A4H5Z4_LEIBR|nr:conserved hypothetical protein [Leishmania braziliensis MHOM/BR/75/M2904]CAJ2467681.1 unnamed protein product [Leishmania braziliensis]CAM37215.2 conserved hypothetical protein [Leishmania braziliensis MHOM/BR/75/M2904]SYZ63389.1 hypothetical_protein [Leishmania braziliensis MHOM/BR/75/M2904]